jgi:integrase
MELKDKRTPLTHPAENKIILHNEYNGGVIMSLRQRGTILCNKCRKTKKDDHKKVCDCGHDKFYIWLYWKGKHYPIRRDSNDETLSYREATKILIQINQEIEDPKVHFNPVDWTEAKIRQRKFPVQFEEYLNEKQEELEDGELSPEHYRHMVSYRNTYFGFFDDYDIKDISLETIADFKKKELKFKKATEERMKAKSKKNILNTLHAFFRWLKKNGKISEMPEFPEVNNKDSVRRKALRRDVQIHALEQLPVEHTDPILFMMKTGIRPGECVAILAKSVDIDNRVIWIERARSGSEYVERTKNKEALPVPLNNIALEIVERNIKGKFPNDFLFINPSTGKGYTQWFLWDIWKRYSGTEVTLYEATRHSYCSQIVPLTDKLTAQRLMRHKDSRSTDVYYHAYADHLLDVVQRMDNVVDIREPKKGTEKEPNVSR